MTGAFLGVIIRKPSNKLLGVIIGFAGGLMLSVVVFDLIPEALEKWSFIGTIIFCVLGVIVVSVVDNKMAINNMDKHMKVAFMTALGLMIHNFPEGIIMGCGFAAGGALGIKMSIIIAIHDIPEGIAVAAPLIASRVKVAKILFYTFVTAFPTAIGTFIGAYIAGISVNVLGACLSFASGIMLYVVCGEMIPESSKLWDGVTSTVGVLSGIMVGLIMVKIL
ncbi:ZIP family metal transporter [Clostridiaceae bacterium UIB06]|uniref:ZIP family metal transporter n=1 Tax=Clostridium thailandense TaxID=2794346 RepID=A0A949TS56_9CLOT|nr:ZIP family metal transporter [Clostridium thailandense]MBV7272351.1 ZIP family metal transporter [Clostridium thailandense]MCH5135936.1 ZIP family metal transporter [Clostridiaceae bacterium UIB06]